MTDIIRAIADLIFGAAGVFALASIIHSIARKVHS